MSHKYDDKMSGKGDFHVVHQGGGVAVAAFKTENDANEDCGTRNKRGEKLGIGRPYAVAPKSEGVAVKNSPKK